MATCTEKDAQNALDAFYCQMKADISKKDVNFNEGVIKFSKVYKKLGMGQKSSSLHCFGRNWSRAAKGKIPVQVTAVQKRAIKES